MRGKKLVDVWVVHDIHAKWESDPDYEKAILREVRLKEQLDEPLFVRLEFFLRKEHREKKMDLDNMIKNLIESLNSNEGRKPHAEEYPIYDDSWIDAIEATKMLTEGDEKTHIEIWEWQQ